MKKLLALILAILMVLCTFASCGGGSASGNIELPDDEKQQTEDNGQSGNIEDDKTDNGGQTNQDNNGQNTGNGNGSNGNGSNGGGNGGTSACAHVDDDKNHSCDKCNDKMTDCADASKDHKCDICGNKLTDCADNDKNHACDICTIKLSDCADNNKDHNCDLCGAANGVAHIEGEGKHSCDYCGIVISICIDNDTDHKCDQCGIDTGVAHVEGEGKHTCGYCGVVISICIDNNTDHKCDQCGATGMGAHADGDDNDHLCDYCEQSVGEDCYDIEPKDHICDECGSNMGTHSDSANDGNHTCDYGCGATLTSCNDSDKDHDCDECGATTSHNYENGYCTVCGEKEWVYTRNGNKIAFGSYPQSEVTDSNLKSTLTGKAGTLPTSSNSQAWTSYGYYRSGNVSNFMWYIDIEQDDEKYRGVYFTSYRPYYTMNSSSTDNTYQDDNGYTTSTVYWFKYEPISWTILSENTTDGTSLILCDMIIDSQEYYINPNSRTIDGKSVYPNNYAHSTIRKWLNETFYNTAFSELQKQIILTTTVDNSVASTGYSTNQYACENTQDKIFLLSAQEVTNTAYGFASSTSTYDTTRRKKITDYAQAQGAYTSTRTDYAGNGYWWLRSPYSDGFSLACGVYCNGNARYYGNVYGTDSGVVPALQIRL